MAKVKSSDGVNRIAADSPTVVRVEPARLEVVTVTIRGDAPYVQHAFSAKARGIMRASQEEGSRKEGKRKREARDFAAECEEATHRSHPDGWAGIPAASLRAAMISACRVAGLVMTRAKLSVFVVPDGFDADGTPLVRITRGEPVPHEASVRLESGVASVVMRPMWAPGWEAKVRVRYDADQFDAASVVNLLARAGAQVGVGEGRPDSKRSSGCGWGTFEVLGGGA